MGENLKRIRGGQREPVRRRRKKRKRRKRRKTKTCRV